MTQTALARRLRKNLTHTEKKLWSHLRRKQMKGFKFRRQCPVGPYIVDFVCFDAMLVIEVDGGHHSLQSEEDAERSDWLGKQGFRVLRFWNHEVLQQTSSVLETILDNLKQPTTKTRPRPGPPQQVGRE